MFRHRKKTRREQEFSLNCYRSGAELVIFRTASEAFPEAFLCQAGMTSPCEWGETGGGSDCT